MFGLVADLLVQLNAQFEKNLNVKTSFAFNALIARALYFPLRYLMVPHAISSVLIPSHGEQLVQIKPCLKGLIKDFESIYCKNETTRPLKFAALAQLIVCHIIEGDIPLTKTHFGELVKTATKDLKAIDMKKDGKDEYITSLFTLYLATVCSLFSQI